MDCMDDQYGFDAIFVSEVPEYLKCTICHLVLRQPLQIMKCGHKFCKPCFNRIKAYAENFNNELICPIDRETIDLNKVFEDNGINRVIGDLIVKCANDSTGCMWTGDLRELKVHEERCKHKPVQEFRGQVNIQEAEGSSQLLKELSERMLKCEDSLMEKEKDIAFLKFSLQEVKQTLNEKSLELDAVKSRNKNLESDLKDIKQQNTEIKQSEVKVENLLLKNAILEQKLLSLENQFLHSQKLQGDNQIELANVQGAIVGEAKGMSEKQLLEVKNELKDLCNSKSHKSDIQKQMEDKYDALDEKCDGNSQMLESLRSHVTNLENISFSDANGKEITLQWRLQNYKYHFGIGKKVFSPILYTRVTGYCFKFKIHWRGENKTNLYVGMYLSCGSDCDEILEPFSVPHNIEMVDKNGNVTSKRVRLDWIKENSREHFSVRPGEKAAQKSYGYTKFLTMPALQNYIVNDTISLRCRFSLP